MADASVATGTTGALVRVLTGLGTDSADQQVMTLADSAGNLLGTTGAPIPTAQQGALPTGTNTIGNVGGASVNVTGTLAATNAVVDGTTDLSLYTSVRFAITGTFVGTIQFQVSNDQTNWVARNFLSLTGSILSSSSTGVINMYGDIGGRYFRLLMSTYTSGTATAQILYTTAAASPQSVYIGPASNVIGAVNIGLSTPLAFTTTSAATTNATVVKTGSGNLQEVTVSNPTATAAYFKLYNKASAPTVGTDTPIAVFRVAATGSPGDSLNLSFGPNGKRFATGIAWALTGAAAATDTTVAVAGVLVSGTYV